MQVPHPHLNLKARRLFELIYKNQKISLTGSKKTLEDQLNLYLDHLSSHLGVDVSPRDRQKIIEIIDRDNDVAKVLTSKAFKQHVLRKKQLIGPVSLGLVFCIDGRIPAIFLGSRFASHWEIPAGELKVTKRKSDKKLIPESTELCESLRKLVNSEKELLEIVFAHTSLLDPSHGCGAMAAKRANGELDPNLTNEDANLKLIENVTIPAITNMYNEFRAQKGFEPLSAVGISALYDTDTFGVILNYDKRSEGESLSTTDLTNTFKHLMDDYFIKDNLVFGSFFERFTHLKYLNAFSGNILKITETLLEGKEFTDLRELVESYIEEHYQDLSSDQKRALKFFILRTIAFQYLSGACVATKKNLSHAFAHHEEEYMAVSTRGTTLGKFDPESQGFSSTPSDAQSAVGVIKTKLSIMGHKKHDHNYILFICNPVHPRDLRENSNQLHKIMDANAELFKAVINDKELWEMIEKAELIPVSILIEEDSREVLKVIDHSAYI